MYLPPHLPNGLLDLIMARDPPHLSAGLLYARHQKRPELLQVEVPPGRFRNHDHDYEEAFRSFELLCIMCVLSG